MVKERFEAALNTPEESSIYTYIHIYTRMLGLPESTYPMASLLENTLSKGVTRVSKTFRFLSKTVTKIETNKKCQTVSKTCPKSVKKTVGKGQIRGKNMFEKIHKSAKNLSNNVKTVSNSDKKVTQYPTNAPNPSNSHKTVSKIHRSLSKSSRHATKKFQETFEKREKVMSGIVFDAFGKVFVTFLKLLDLIFDTFL